MPVLQPPAQPYEPPYTRHQYDPPYLCPFLEGMGVEPSKLPQADDWNRMLLEDFSLPIQDKKFYYVLWELNHQPVGHSNINKIIFGQEAYMHLHL